MTANKTKNARHENYDLPFPLNGKKVCDVLKISRRN